MPLTLSQNISKDERRALFDAAAVAEQDWQNARRVQESMLNLRSIAIRKILKAYGRGPWIVNNEEVIIVERGDTCFFRAINKKKAEEI